jgi:hypothetical protein
MSFRSIGCFAALIAAAFTGAPASAGGLLDALFGGFTRRAPVILEDTGREVSEPFSRMLGTVEPSAPRGESGPRVAFCVRSCDGRYFPVQAHPGFSAAQMCNSFCPASETRLYSGGTIDNAVGSDGKRYSDLSTAFLYRQRVVDGCTCNGRDGFGLASINVDSDPTLRPGDVVATKQGLVSVSGKTDKGAQFTPVSGKRGYADNSQTAVKPSRRDRPETTGSAAGAD